MIATYKGGGTELTFSADTASAAAAGSAQRPGDAAPVTPERMVRDEDIEAEINKAERKERILSRVLEYGTSQLSSMRAAMAKNHLEEYQGATCLARDAEARPGRQHPRRQRRSAVRADRFICS